MELNSLFPSFQDMMYTVHTDTRGSRLESRDVTFSFSSCTRLEHEIFPQSRYWRSSIYAKADSDICDSGQWIVFCI